MTMTADESRRFGALQQPWCGAWLIRELYGIDVDTDDRLRGIFRTWAARFRRGRMVEQHQHGEIQIDRHELETFFQLNDVRPRKWAAIELAMSQDSLDQILDALVGAVLPIQPVSSISRQLIDNKTINDLYKWFPRLRHKTFSSHSSMCKALHEAIHQEYAIDVEVLYCATSSVIEPDEPDLATYFDAITLEPVGLRYEIWLDFGKPVNLKPDCCSLKLYARERSVLQPFVYKGNAPEAIPETLLKTGT